VLHPHVVQEKKNLPYFSQLLGGVVLLPREIMTGYTSSPARAYAPLQEVKKAPDSKKKMWTEKLFSHGEIFVGLGFFFQLQMHLF